MGYFTRRKTESVELTEVSVNWLGINAKWVADRQQQMAAWEMYVELVTRIAMQPLDDDRGVLREALNSLYSLFAETRRILKAYGPRVAHNMAKDQVTFAHMAVAVLNQVLRPFLSKWHPALQELEALKPADTAVSAHEKTWKHAKAMRLELEEVRRQMEVYADGLAASAGIDRLHAPPARGANR